MLEGLEKYKNPEKSPKRIYIEILLSLSKIKICPFLEVPEEKAEARPFTGIYKTGMFT